MKVYEAHLMDDFRMPKNAILISVNQLSSFIQREIEETYSFKNAFFLHEFLNRTCIYIQFHPPHINEYSLLTLFHV